MDAAELYLQDKDENSALLARDAILRAVWEQIAFGRVAEHDSKGVQRLLKLVRRLRGLELHEGDVDEVSSSYACNIIDGLFLRSELSTV